MKDIKINDAAYFPRPQAIYKALPIARTMGEAAAEYMAGWEFNGLNRKPAAGFYRRNWQHLGGVKKPQSSSFFSAVFFIFFLFFVLTQNKKECIL